ncbi:WD repeat-containing mio-B [Brachionus plicatilis]|uniref:WD repeat-containing mio-B n=1 Tax=Brachionus plicatilis TaxID=10195 RepID=A0A3M7RBF5_BRAPC|nr:WD repeat-containing mio-B [Brachionus plicatilis]
MKLKKYQTLTSLPDHANKIQTDSEPNIPSSSSSTSSLNSISRTNQASQLRNNSHSYNQINSTQSQPQGNQVNFSLNSLNTRPNVTRMVTSQSMNFQVNLSKRPTVFLNCNSCGKNIMEKPSSSANSYLIGSANAMNNFNLLPHDTSLDWCLNCSKFLPHCVVCLRLMKVNLVSAPLVSILQPSISRVQTTPKIMHPYGQPKKMSVQYKSPGKLDMSGFAGKHFYIDENTENQNDKMHIIRKELNERITHMNKVEILFSNKFFMLKSTKFGNWFSWCMSCHHGGHIKHLINWFRFNQKCPYLHCKCQCTNLDHIID